MILNSNLLLLLVCPLCKLCNIQIHLAQHHRLFLTHRYPRHYLPRHYKYRCRFYPHQNFQYISRQYHNRYQYSPHQNCLTFSHRHHRQFLTLLLNYFIALFLQFF